MMRTAVLEEVGSLRLKQVPIPGLGPGEALVRIETNTIYDTDLRIVSKARTVRIRLGVTLGHEFTGRVTTVGRGAGGVPVGAQMACSTVMGCQQRRARLSGWEQPCGNLVSFGYEPNGGLAEYPLVPKTATDHGNFVMLGKEIPATTLVLTGPVSCCLNGAGQVTVAPGESVIVLGAGPAGLLRIVLTKLAGVTMILAAGREGRLTAATGFGVTCTVALTGETPTVEVRERTNGRGANTVIVTVGDLTPANQALELTTIDGRIDYSASFPKGETASIDPNLIHYHELAVTGRSNARWADVRRAAELLSSGALDVGRLVTYQFPLTELEAAVTTVA